METIESEQAQELPRLRVVATAAGAPQRLGNPAAGGLGGAKEVAELRTALTDCDGWAQGACDVIEAIASGARSLLGSECRQVRTLLLEIERRASDLQNDINTGAEAHGANFVAEAHGEGAPAAEEWEDDSSEAVEAARALRNSLADFDALAGEAHRSIAALAQAARALLPEQHASVDPLILEIERYALSLRLDIDAEAVRLGAGYIAA